MPEFNTNVNWTEMDEKLKNSKSVEEKREHFAAKYQWIKENHPDYWKSADWKNWVKRLNLLDRLRQYNPDSILDVGCGGGGFLREVKNSEICDNVYGLDIVDGVLEEREGIVFDFGHYARDLPYSDKQFDVVTSFDVLEHMIEEDVLRVLEEIFRVASKRVILTVCGRKSGWGRDQGYGIGELHSVCHLTTRKTEWWKEQILPFCLKDYYLNDEYVDPTKTTFWDIEV